VRRAIYHEVRAIVQDRTGFVVDREVVQAADEFLSVSDALGQPYPMGTSAGERQRRTA
jgi:hypothetical protein